MPLTTGRRTLEHAVEIETVSPWRTTCTCACGWTYTSHDASWARLVAQTHLLGG